MFDLSMLEWLIVVHLSASAAISLTTLARSASLDPQRTSVAVSRLASRDLLTRTKNPENAREVLVALTPRGQAVFNAIIENWLDKELFAGFTPAERANARALLGRVATAAERILQNDAKGVG